MDLRRLSEEANRNATNPYPIYSAIEKYCFSNGPIEGVYAHATIRLTLVFDLYYCAVCKNQTVCLLGKWFEVSPHEAGFTEMGLFVQTSLMGSKFQNGELLEEKPEMDMVKLQGVCLCVCLGKSYIGVQ